MLPVVGALTTEAIDAVRFNPEASPSNTNVSVPAKHHQPRHHAALGRLQKYLHTKNRQVKHKAKKLKTKKM
jgi:hypothetical protein